jgi:hypothetical protein
MRRSGRGGAPLLLGNHFQRIGIKSEFVATFLAAAIFKKHQHAAVVAVKVFHRLQINEQAWQP